MRNQGERAAYGEQIVSKLEQEYDRGFSAKNLRHMLRLCRGLPRCADCLDTVETIVMESLFRADLLKRYASALLL